MPWRTMLVTALLVCTGLVFILVGTLHFGDKNKKASIALVVVGAIMVLPGGYLVFNLVQTWRGVRGFHLSECRLLADRENIVAFLTMLVFFFYVANVS